MVVSAWNPIDGWMSSRKTQMEVLARIGPITIDDKLIVTDKVKTGRRKSDTRNKDGVTR